MLHDALVRAAAERPDQAALRAGDDTWTFADLDRYSQGFAGLLADLGVTAGERVAVMSTNRPEFLAAVEGISRLGAAAVLISPAWREAEVRAAVELTGPVHAVADAPGTDVLRAVLGPEHVTDLDTFRLASLAQGSEGDHEALVERSEPLGERSRNPEPLVERSRNPELLVERSERSERSRNPATEDDDAVLVFSSGTTGLPKAVRHTHRSLGRATAHWVHALGLGPDDRFQVATPPSHILGLLNLLAAVEAGATVRLHPRFDLDAVLRSIEADRLTLEMAVAPIALALAAHPNLEEHDLSSLRYIMWGATPVTPSVAEAVTARTGVRWLPAYGASELPVLAANPVGEPDRWRLDSAGLPAPEVELRVVDLDTGEVLPPGETGEIQARSPSLMAGYLPAEATDEVIVDGWYRTGDVGWMEPEGWVHLTDRSKEMIKVNGFQVAPAEIEAVLHGHPAVADCAVFGLPDPSAGEVPVAVVAWDPAADATGQELIDLVADTLATYKQLRHLVVVDEIPRLPSGKVLRRTLRDEWAPRLLVDDTATTTDPDPEPPPS
ncbi:MAG: acyl--CoA ligase [Actinobacteria bacterium]|nr:acyl--CoA ligase [Actinomycetota bacterium]